MVPCISWDRKLFVNTDELAAGYDDLELSVTNKMRNLFQDKAIPRNIKTTQDKHQLPKALKFSGWVNQLELNATISWMDYQQ